MTMYDYQAIKELWIVHGGDVANSDIAAAVALAESAGNSDAKLINTNASVDRGLFQINSVHGAQSTFEVGSNVVAAIGISLNGTNWRPWCTAYTDGACGTRGGRYDVFGDSPAGRIFQANHGAQSSGYPELNFGMKDDARVAYLQSFMNRTFPAYSKLPVTGNYLTMTAAVMAEFQRRVGIHAAEPGMHVGPITNPWLAHYGYRPV